VDLVTTLHLFAAARSKLHASGLKNLGIDDPPPGLVEALLGLDLAARLIGTLDDVAVIPHHGLNCLEGRLEVRSPRKQRLVRRPASAPQDEEHKRTCELEDGGGALSGHLIVAAPCKSSLSQGPTAFNPRVGVYRRCMRTAAGLRRLSQRLILLGLERKSNYGRQFNRASRRGSRC
jgi:hypothetical protein